MSRNTGNSNLLATLLLAVFATLLLALVGWLLPPPTIAIAIGNETGLNAYGQGENLYNFFGWGNPGTEKGKQARRIEPVASLMIPYARRLGSPLTLEVTMCGCGHTAPVTLTLNQEQHRVELSNEWESYQFSLANTFAPPSSPTDEIFPIVYNRSLYIEWRSDAAMRPLVHRVVLRAEAPDGYPMGSVLAGLFIIGVVLLSGNSGQETGDRGNRGQETGDRYLWVGVLLASAGVARWLYQPHLLPWLAVVALGGFAAVLLTLFCSNLRHRLVLWGLAVWLLAAPFVSGTWILDDAFISFRYARNLVEGAGLTFNPGGEIVEGYTNFLWTMIIAGGLAVGFEPVLMAHILCTGLSLATLVLVYRFAVAWWGGGAWSLLPPLLLAIMPSFLLYTARSSGMETALVTFLATGALWLLWRVHDGRSGLLAGMACALVTMTRPDGVLVPGAGVLARVIPLFSQWCKKNTEDAQDTQSTPENQAISRSPDPQPPNPSPRPPTPPARRLPSI
jgi:arabinofuranosyltransferase